MKPPAKRGPPPIPKKVLRQTAPQKRRGGVSLTYYLRALSKALG